MTTRKRLTKRIPKQQLKRDRFVDTTFDWALWIRENARTAGIIAGVVGLVVLGLLLYRRSLGSSSGRAASRFQEVRQTYAVGNYQLAANDFKQFKSQYGSSEYGDEATIYLGDSYFKAGDYPSAIKVLQSFEDEYDGSHLRHAAASLLAASYEAAGDLVNAAKTYKHARELAEFDYQRAAALMDGARVFTAQGDKGKAASTYREVVEKYPDSPSGREARVRLAEVTAEPIRGGEAATDSVPGSATRTSGDSSVPTSSLIDAPGDSVATAVGEAFRGAADSASDLEDR